MRDPTSHERSFGQPWDASYQNGPAPWDIGRPQAAIVRLAAQNAFAGNVLDAGCGTGEHALYLATLGCTVLAVDVAQTALAIARENAEQRGIRNVDFILEDALHLERLERRFDTILDCGLFHTFDAQERRVYVGSLAAVTRPGAALYVLCFADRGRGLGPHPVGQDDLRGAFESDSAWTVASIEPERIETRFADAGVPAWLASIKRI